MSEPTQAPCMWTKREPNHEGQLSLNIYHWPDTQPKETPWLVVISEYPYPINTDSVYLEAATAKEARTKLAEWLIERI